jgi:hypothetical protein
MFGNSLFPHEMWESVDWCDPVGRHTLNDSLEAWYLTSPRTGFGTATWLDLCRKADGTLTSMAPTTDWQGPRGRQGSWGCLDFGGGADDKRVLVSASTVTSLPTSNFTVSFWAQAANTVNAAALSWYGTDDLVFYPYSTTGGDGVLVFWRDVGGIAFINENGVTRTGWNHFLLTSRGSTDHECFVNGVSIATSSTSSASAGPFTGFALGVLGDDLNQEFNGQIDSVRLLSRGYTSVEAMELYVAEQSYYPGLLNRIRRRTINAPAAGTSAMLLRMQTEGLYVGSAM